MPHLDPEELSLLALYGDTQDVNARDHLRDCPECAADYAALRRAVDAVKATPDAGSLEAPGPNVWAGIHRELGLSPSLRDDPLVPAAVHGPAREQQRAAGGEQGGFPEPAPPTPIQSRSTMRGTMAWWQRPGPWLGAAAATILVAAGAVWTLSRAPEPLAEAELAPLAQYSATGSARVVAAADGSRTLEVTLSKDEAQGYQEVWLIAPDLSKLVSLGVLNSAKATFDVPSGLELADFPIVDVSDEPVDGNPAHSSVSIVRGTLTS